MGYKLIVQLVLLITSFVIIFTFITPYVTSISEKQDKVLEYEQTLGKAAELNAKLNELIATKNSISPNEMRALNTYLPSRIYHIEVMRDIQNIFDVNRIPILTMTSDAEGVLSKVAVVEGGPKNTSDSGISYRDFNITFVAEYEIFKSILASIESNAYPLEVMNLSFAAQDEIHPEINSSGQMRYSLLLRAFALTNAL